MLCDVTPSYVWHAPYVWHDSFLGVTWLISATEHGEPHPRSRTWWVRVDSFICVTWLIHMCDMTHTCDMTRRDISPLANQVSSWGLIICVTWLLHMCGMPHICDMTHSCVSNNLNQPEHGGPHLRLGTRWVRWEHACDITHSYMFIHICDITHSYMWHASCVWQIPHVWHTHEACCGSPYLYRGIYIEAFVTHMSVCPYLYRGICHTHECHTWGICHTHVTHICVTWPRCVT